MEWQTIVAGALLLVIAVAIAFLLARLQEIKDRILAALSLLAAIALFILGAFFKPLPPDYVSLHQPWLEADLIVSDLQEGTFRLAYEIRNLGKLPARNPRLFFMIAGITTGFDLSKLWPRTIAPGAPITFPLGASRWDKKKLPPAIKSTLWLDYTAQVGDITRTFRSAFGNYYLRLDELKEGRYKPLAVNHEEGRFPNEEIAKVFGFSPPSSK